MSKRIAVCLLTTFVFFLAGCGRSQPLEQSALSSDPQDVYLNTVVDSLTSLMVARDKIAALSETPLPSSERWQSELRAVHDEVVETYRQAAQVPVPNGFEQFHVLWTEMMDVCIEGLYYFDEDGKFLGGMILDGEFRMVQPRDAQYSCDYKMLDLTGLLYDLDGEQQ